MKKLFWVNALLLTLLLVSCATTYKNNTLIVNTALNLANRQVQLNQLEDALNTYNEALTHGHDYSLLYNKSVVQAKLGDYEGAIETAEFCYRKYKDKTDILLALAQYFFYNNNTDKSLKTFDKYFKLNPNDVDAKVIYMKLCNEAGMTDTAYNQALTLWESGTNTSDVINVLHSINEEEWKTVKKLFD